MILTYTLYTKLSCLYTVRFRTRHSSLNFFLPKRKRLRVLVAALRIVCTATVMTSRAVNPCHGSAGAPSWSQTCCN